jgi:hypothetical protein
MLHRMLDAYNVSPMEHDEPIDAPEPRWPAILAVVAVGGLYAALPASLSVGPRWLLLLIVLILLVPTILSHRQGMHGVNKVFGHLLAAVLTLFMVWSVVLLVMALPAHTELPVTLLRSATALWITNVLVFAIWYWRLDAGGPHERDEREAHEGGSFLFPQTMLKDQKTDGRWNSWSPNFVDYLYLSFNTSTAFSPTDTPVLTRWAKVITMLQASISLTVVAILAARAVNIL